MLSPSLLLGFQLFGQMQNNISEEVKKQLGDITCNCLILLSHLLTRKERQPAINQGREYS